MNFYSYFPQLGLLDVGENRFKRFVHNGVEYVLVS